MAIAAMILGKIRNRYPGVNEVFEEHSQVSLTRPLPALRLEAGAVGVVVHIHGSGVAYEVEFMTPDGKTVGVETLLAADLIRSRT